MCGKDYDTVLQVIQRSHLSRLRDGPAGVEEVDCDSSSLLLVGTLEFDNRVFLDLVSMVSVAGDTPSTYSFYFELLDVLALYLVQ